MASPFPGMDPYLEDPAFWQDFHRSFITYCRDALLDNLPDAYEARIDEQVRLVERTPERLTTRVPDIAVTREPTGAGKAAPTRSGAVGTLEPVTIPMIAEAEEVRATWIEILHRPARDLITVIEVLSPTNKSGVGYWEYRNKRVEMLGRGIHLVEIDLLLGGRRNELRDPLPRGDYYAFVTRAQRKLETDVYAWNLRDPLPTIPVPLKTPDADVGLNIAEVFEITYQRGRYARSLPYGIGPTAPLEGEARSWATDQGKTGSAG